MVDWTSAAIGGTTAFVIVMGVKWPVLVLAALALLVVGFGLGYWIHWG